MITVEVIDKDFQIEIGAKNIVTSCADATVTATNSLSTVLGTVSAPSGGTGNIPISDSPISKSDGTLIANVPAETSYTVADSVITVEYVNGTPISITNVKATDAALIEVPNPTACPTLADLVDSSTVADVISAIELAGKTCDVTDGLLDNFGSSPSVLGQFGTLTSLNAFSVFVNANIAYVLNDTTIELYNATTFAYIGSVLGFNRAAEIAFYDTTYVVVNFGDSTARVMDIATNIEITSFSVVSSPFAVCYSDDGTLIYVAGFTAAGSVSIYNTSGVLQGTVSGFDNNIIEMRTVGTEYWVLTTTGQANASTQRVRKMRFSDNTQVSSHSLGNVATIGAVRAMVVNGSNVYVAVSVGNQVVYKIICYELDFTSPVTYNVGLSSGGNTYGLTVNPNRCNTFVMSSPAAGTCFNIML